MTNRQEIRAKALTAAIGVFEAIRPKRIFTVNLDGTENDISPSDAQALIDEIIKVSERFEDFILTAPDD